MMRLFIAVGLGKDYFLEIQDRLDRTLARMALTKTFHLTLKFLGEVGLGKLADIKDRLLKIKSSPFQVEFSKVGVFPDWNHINVIWVGLSDNRESIRLGSEIENALSGLFPKDDKFHPHVTLARVKSVIDRGKLKELLADLQIEKKTFQVDSFLLIRSTLTGDGPVYEVLERFII